MSKFISVSAIFFMTASYIVYTLSSLASLTMFNVEFSFSFSKVFLLPEKRVRQG